MQIYTAKSTCGTGTTGLEILCSMVEDTNYQGVHRNLSRLLQVCLHNLIINIHYFLNFKTSSIARRDLDLVVGFQGAGRRYRM
jgi:hypothetical protein